MFGVKSFTAVSSQNEIAHYFYFRHYHMLLSRSDCLPAPMYTFWSGLFPWGFLIIKLSTFFVSLIHGAFPFLLDFISWWFRDKVIEISFCHLIQVLLSIIIFPKSVIEVYKPIILVVFCSCGTWSLILREEERLNVWREYFRPKMVGKNDQRRCIIIWTVHLYFFSKSYQWSEMEPLGMIVPVRPIVPAIDEDECRTLMKW